MREAVLLQKVYGEVSLKEFEEFLKRLCEGLRVELTGLSVMKSGWVKVLVSGEDENVALSFLKKEVGLAPVTVGNVERFSVLSGRVVLSGQSKGETFVDVGGFLPKVVYAKVSLQRLQGQLADGRKIALERIVELFGLVDGFPLEVRVVETGNDEFSAELAEEQLEVYGGWVDSRVDRLIVLGALGERVEEAIQRARLERDVLGVESLGVLEHAIVCKLGTDAVGLAPKLGRWLREAGFVFFSPRRVLDLVGERW